MGAEVALLEDYLNICGLVGFDFVPLRISLPELQEFLKAANSRLKSGPISNEIKLLFDLKYHFLKLITLYIAINP